MTTPVALLKRGVDDEFPDAPHPAPRRGRWASASFQVNVEDALRVQCPRCGWPIVTIKTTKRKGAEKVCPQKHCSYSEPYQEPTAG